MIAPRALVFRPLVKGNEDSGNENALALVLYSKISTDLGLLKVIPHICIAHPYCAQFMASLARARAHAH